MIIAGQTFRYSSSRPFVDCLWSGGGGGYIAQGGNVQTDRQAGRHIDMIKYKMITYISERYCNISWTGFNCGLKSTQRFKEIQICKALEKVNPGIIRASSQFSRLPIYLNYTWRTTRLNIFVS